MKTIKISDQLHLELTAIVGELTAESGQIKTYEDAVDALVSPFNYFAGKSYNGN